MNPDFIRLQRIFREVLEDESFELRTDYSQDNLSSWDSFAQVKIIIAIEEEFGIHLSIDEASETKSVGGLLGLIRARTGE